LSAVTPRNQQLEILAQNPRQTKAALNRRGFSAVDEPLARARIEKAGYYFGNNKSQSSPKEEIGLKP
jgi:hypothetical protein